MSLRVWALAFLCGGIVFFIISQAIRLFPLLHSNTGDIGAKKIVIFGDSLVEQGYDHIHSGWVSSIANYYIRKVDVVNRGYSGYNTRFALQIVESAVINEKPDLVVILFGANDAVVKEDELHHVPIVEYKSNLKDIISRLRLGKCRNILLLTPPPIYEEQLKVRNTMKKKAIVLDRTNERTRIYRDAALEVAMEVGVPAVDVFKELKGDEVKAAGRAAFLHDGLHLSHEGNEKLFESFKVAVDNFYPELAPANLPLQYPSHLAMAKRMKILTTGN
jgi:lysophospholipase L1-like esterase